MERCLDSGCNYDNRIDYCYENPLVLGELGSQIPDLLNALLYDDRPAPSDTFALTTNREHFLFTRTTSTISADKSVQDWPLAQAEVVISQDTNKRTGVIIYGVNITKSVLMPWADDEPSESVYIVTQMPSGEVQFEAQDYGLYFKDGVMHTRAVDERHLTMYDCQQLIEIPSLVDNSRGAKD